MHAMILNPSKPQSGSQDIAALALLYAPAAALRMNPRNKASPTQPLNRCDADIGIDDVDDSLSLTQILHFLNGQLVSE